MDFTMSECYATHVMGAKPDPAEDGYGGDDHDRYGLCSERLEQIETWRTEAQRTVDALHQELRPIRRSSAFSVH